MSDIYLGTVAIEPNRWATVDPSWAATIALGDWLDRIAAAGFDGIEVWEKHLSEASEAEAGQILQHEMPVAVFNSYASFDEPDAESRMLAAAWTARSGAWGVKYNLGNDPDAEAVYAERLAAFAEALPGHVQLLCECHEGISVAEDPAVAARIFDAAGGGERLQAICHLSERPDYMRSKFDHLGERITHIHVNFLDGGAAPPLVDIEARLREQVALVMSLGFAGTWTVEFANGLLTEHDEPEFIIEAAASDLTLLRTVIDG